MRNIEKWEEGKEQYTLNNGFKLVKANDDEFGLRYAIYSDMNNEFIYDWNKLSKEYDDYNFWIFKDDKRIGGVGLDMNYLAYFYVEPPYEVDRFSIIKELNNALLQWSDKSKQISIYLVHENDVEHYNRLGYRRSFARKVMIRPTEKFDDINWGETLVIKTPTLEDAEEIGKVMYESYKDGVHYKEFSCNTLEDEVEIANIFLERYVATNTLEASTLVYDKNTNELIGVCLAGKNKADSYDFSKINSIGVKPSYRGLGIAENMIKRSLTVLNDTSSITKLDVTVGNSAEALYYKMGFFSGAQTYAMYKKD